MDGAHFRHTARPNRTISTTLPRRGSRIRIPSSAPSELAGTGIPLLVLMPWSSAPVAEVTGAASTIGWSRGNVGRWTWPTS